MSETSTDTIPDSMVGGCKWNLTEAVRLDTHRFENSLGNKSVLMVAPDPLAKDRVARRGDSILGVHIQLSQE